jgi:hypothetical protein
MVSANDSQCGSCTHASALGRGALIRLIGSGQPNGDYQDGHECGLADRRRKLSISRRGLGPAAAVHRNAA